MIRGCGSSTATRLTYATAGNLEREAGTVEFWLKPDWDGDDELSYTFFEVGYEWFNRMRIMKDGANNLRFMVWDDDTEYGVAYNVGDWLAGEWHHVAVTWQGDEIALYVDGRAGRLDGRRDHAAGLCRALFVGSAALEPQYAQGVIDELRISHVPRVGNSQVCNRILVADSGNHRLQAFDSLGNWLSEFGSLGSGEGQFNNPQGLAVDFKRAGASWLIPATTASWCSTLTALNFTYLTPYTASLSGPTGLAVDGADNLYIADTLNKPHRGVDLDGSLLRRYTAPNDGSDGQFQPALWSGRAGGWVDHRGRHGERAGGEGSTSRPDGLCCCRWWGRWGIEGGPVLSTDEHR